jgi:hypothetical protein
VYSPKSGVTIYCATRRQGRTIELAGAVKLHRRNSEGFEHDPRLIGFHDSAHPRTFMGWWLEMGDTAQATSREPAERAPREPVIPESPRFTEGDTTFAVLSGPVATVTAKKVRKHKAG